MSHSARLLMFSGLALVAQLFAGCGGERPQGNDDDAADDDDDDAAGSCDPAGLWTIQLIPTLEEPNGCGSAGVVAQSAAVHALQVTGTGPSDWTTVLLEPSVEALDSSVLTVDFSGADGACEIAMGLENTVMLPTQAGLAAVVLDYNHSGNSDAGGDLSGVGSVHFYSTETSPSGSVTVLQDCTEAFDLGGSFVADG